MKEDFETVSGDVGRRTINESAKGRVSRPKQTVEGAKEWEEEEEQESVCPLARLCVHAFVYVCVWECVST